MDLRLLEIFCRVYTERSFSRAAREFGLTQPTVSAHVKELEGSLGTPLFVRLGREIQATEAGRLLYQHASPIVAAKCVAIDKMAAFLNRIEGVLTVGASSVPGECLLPGVMTGFHGRHPGVQARLRISDTGDTLEQLRHGDIEIGVVGARTRDDELQFEPLAQDALVLAVPGTADWRHRRQLTLGEVRELPVLVREMGSGTRTVLERVLARRKLTLADMNVAAELGSLGAIKEGVKRGFGVSFISQLAIASELRTGFVRVAQVRELGSIGRTYYIVVNRRRVLSPLTRAFLAYVRSMSAAASRPERRRTRAAGA